MAHIVISENVSLDGVVEDPTGAAGFERGGWGNELTDGDRVEWAKIGLEESLAAQALLLGRRTYEFFAGRFPARNDPWANRLNTMPKYVISSTVTHPQWNNSTVLDGDVVQEVSSLKRQLDGEILVYASSQLVPTLLEHDLGDELRLIIYPFVLGGGERLFKATSERKPLSLTGAETVGDALALLTYKLV